MTLYAGDRSPKAYQLVLRREDIDVDFTEVTAWELHIRLPSGKKGIVWDATASEVTSSGAKVTHILAADGSDLPVSGAYDIYVNLTIGGGRLQSDPVTEFVEDPYGVRV